MRLHVPRAAQRQPTCYQRSPHMQGNNLPTALHLPWVAMHAHIHGILIRHHYMCPLLPCAMRRGGRVVSLISWCKAPWKRKIVYSPQLHLKSFKRRQVIISLSLLRHVSSACRTFRRNATNNCVLHTPGYLAARTHGVRKLPTYLP